MTRRAGLLALLASAVAATAAPAAERPSAAGQGAAPAVACPGKGPGFVQIPGSTACVRIDGRVRAEAGGSTRRFDRDRIVGGSSAQVSTDVRADTEAGPVRGYLRVRGGAGLR